MQFPNKLSPYQRLEIQTLSQDVTNVHKTKKRDFKEG